MQTQSADKTEGMDPGQLRAAAFEAIRKALGDEGLKRFVEENGLGTEVSEAGWATWRQRKQFAQSLLERRRQSA